MQIIVNNSIRTNCENKHIIKETAITDIISREAIIFFSPEMRIFYYSVAKQYILLFPSTKYSLLNVLFLLE